MTAARERHRPMAPSKSSARPMESAARHPRLERGGDAIWGASPQAHSPPAGAFGYHGSLREAQHRILLRTLRGDQRSGSSSLPQKRRAREIGCVD